MAKLRGILNPNSSATRRAFLIAGAFIVGFFILGLLGVQVWEYSNSVAFCSDACHNVHPEEPAAFQDSFHARVKCTECHMGRVGTLRNMVLKVSHFRRLPEVLFDRYERPVESESLRPPNESCERCHWPPAFHGDTVREIKRYQPDEENALNRIFLILKTGGGERERGLGAGIHWHIENPVEFIATDERSQEIRWVRTVLPDGRTVEYNDVTNPLSPEELVAAEPKLMDCVDCHNRVGHPFPPPGPAVDQAIAEGRINEDLPYIKQDLTELLSTNYPDQKTALEAVEAFEQEYRAAHPDVVEEQAAYFEQAVGVTYDLLSQLVFEEPGVNWLFFPDNSQHKAFPGCFRCHDGNHLSSAGESIRLHCDICHSIPATVSANDRPPQMPVVTVDQPASHLDPRFMFEHRFLANDSCAECHGAIEFGSDDSSFCSNSACHGQGWPEVELDAAFTHPIPLVGEHAVAWCHDCHAGVEKPEYVCANCHEPPPDHFEAGCDSCHTPEGWSESATAVTTGAPEIPHVLEGREECMACHNPTAGTVPAPPDHAEFRNGQCQLCHELSAMPAAQAPEIPHPLEGLDECLACHDPAEGSVPAPAGHADYTNEQCEGCHAPAAEPSGGPAIPHTLEGREQCMACHNPDGGVVPAPATHAGFENERCQACHAPAP